MREQDLLTILISAQQKLLSDFAQEQIETRITTIEVNILSAAALSQTLSGRKEKRFYNVPAYYDPNKHRIYLNRTMLRTQSERTIFIICYHELLHAASMHQNYQHNNANFFQSGAKIEQFGYQFYDCSNRLLNEGIVQFLTNYYNNARDEEYAYTEEASLMRAMSVKLGLIPLKNALLNGAIHELEAAFNEAFAPNTFKMFSTLLDKKRYKNAAEFLSTTPLLIIQQPINVTY